jgi:hypothetical protein
VVARGLIAFVVGRVAVHLETASQSFGAEEWVAQMETQTQSVEIWRAVEWAYQSSGTQKPIGGKGYSLSPVVATGSVGTTK